MSLRNLLVSYSLLLSTLFTCAQGAQFLEPNDQAFAVCFANHLRLVSDSTSSAPAIMDGIRSFDKGNTDFAEIGPKESRELGTALYDAVFYSITEKLAAIH